MTGKRIGFACDATLWGGAESCLEQLIPAAGTREVVVFAVDDQIGQRLAKAAAGESRVVLMPARASAVDPRPLRPWITALRRHPVDLLHVNAGFTFGNLYAAAAAALTRTPFVVQEHLPLAGNHPRLQRPVKRLLMRRAAAHIAVSRQAARDTEEFLGLPPGSVDTIVNGIDLDAPDPAVPTLGADTILGVGALIRQKGFDLLVAALPSLPGARLALAGEGPERAPLTRQAQALDVADRVTFLGWRDDARGLLSQAGVVAIPSRAESGPLVLVEALAAARPVVMTRVGLAEEVIGQDARGWVVPVDDVDALGAALAAVRDDPAEAARRASAGQAFVRAGFGRERMVEAWREVYDRALAGRDDMTSV